MTDHTVLLVEDNPDDVALTRLAFEDIQFSHKVAVAKDGAEALDYLFGTGPYAGRKPATPVLVVLDLKLPKITGLEVLKRIRSDPGLKLLFVVVLTSSNEDRDRKEASLLGAHLFLRKAVDYNQFLDVVRIIESLMLSAK